MADLRWAVLAVAPLSPDEPAEASMSLERYERLVATNPGVERKGKTLPYMSLNGHMFSFLDSDGTIALRLSPADRQELTRV
jgi:hypothetical protein